MKTPTSLTLQPGSLLSPPDLGEFFRDANARVTGPWNTRLGFAYATEAGLDALLVAANPLPRWNNGAKRWLLGIHHGITEPAAIQRMGSIGPSEVRLFLGGQTIREAIVSPPHFHAKLIAINSGSRERLKALWVSSANLTGNALSPRARNFELGVSAITSSTQLDSSVRASLDNWWSTAWRASVGATDARLTQYAAERERFIRRNPDSIYEIEGPARDRILNATSLCIEAGAMSGGSRNQIEFNRDLAAFFGTVSATRRLLPISHRGRVWMDRPLSPKRTTFGVEIWRLSLPTEMQSGLDYPGKVIRFRKRQVNRQIQFELDVADVGSAAGRRWRTEARRQGYIGMTSGLRNYGLI